MSGDIAMIAPKLDGPESFEEWKEFLEVAIRGKDLDYWNILVGKITKPRGQAPCPTDFATVRNKLAKHHGVDPLDLTIEQVDKECEERGLRNSEVKKNYRKECDQFSQRMFAVLAIIVSTLGPRPRARVRGMRDAHEVWSVLNDTYGPKDNNQMLLAYQKVASMRFKEFESHQAYVSNFKDAMNHLYNAGQDCFEKHLEYVMFMTSISGTPVLDPLLAEINDSGRNFNMEDIYSKFIDLESQRKSAQQHTAFQTSTSKTDNEKKDKNDDAEDDNRGISSPFPWGNDRGLDRDSRGGGRDDSWGSDRVDSWGYNRDDPCEGVGVHFWGDNRDDYWGGSRNDSRGIGRVDSWGDGRDDSWGGSRGERSDISQRYPGDTSCWHHNAFGNHHASECNLKDKPGSRGRGYGVPGSGGRGGRGGGRGGYSGRGNYANTIYTPDSTAETTQKAYSFW